MAVACIRSLPPIPSLEQKNGADNGPDVLEFFPRNLSPYVSTCYDTWKAAPFPHFSPNQRAGIG